MNEESQVNVCHYQTLITSLSFVHTARRYLERINIGILWRYKLTCSHVSVVLKQCDNVCMDRVKVVTR